MAEIEKLCCTDSKVETLKKINTFIDNTANTDLSNLSEAGQVILDTKTNIDLSNLSATGEAKLNNLVKTKVDRNELSKVATSGSYNDLSNKPAQYVLPTATETGLGGVKIDGETIQINDGVISATVKPHDLFDTVIKDHVLTYEETKGLALQGTYVYKEALAGSRYGYPDFYNKCLEEYNEATEKLIIGIPITLPTFTANTTGGITVSNSLSNTDAYTLINGVTSKTVGLWSNYWFNIDYGQDTIINSYTIQADNSGEPEYPTDWTLQGSNNGTTFDILDTQSGITFSLNQSKTFTVTTNKAYKQYRLVFSAGKLASNNGELGKIGFNVNSVITGKQNSNGHTFYDVTDKDFVDSLFTVTGTAWFYGVDTENERIFLPRNNFFDQLTGDTTEVGQSVEAGLPNIKGTAQFGDSNNGGSGESTCGGVSLHKDSDALWYRDTTWSTGKSIRAGNDEDVGAYNYGIGFDASRSNPIYGNSDTVQPPAVKKLLYICVGNTTNYEGVTDVVNQGMEILEQINEGFVQKDSMVELPIVTTPDYANKIQVTSVPFTAPCAGYFTAFSSVASSTSWVGEDITVNSVPMFFFNNSNSAIYNTQSWVILDKGDVVECSRFGTENPSYFIPMKGAN